MGIVVILILLFLVICLLLSSKAYLSVPIYELKRRSRTDDKVSKTLYQVAVYQRSYRVLNSLLVLILVSFLYILTVHHFKEFLAFVLVFIVTFIIFFWLPKKPAGSFSNYLARILARPLKFILGYFDPISSKLFKSQSVYKRYSHTGIYEQADVYHLIEQQKKQEDSRLEEYQLDIIKNVLDFNKLKVVDLMTTRRKVKSFSADDSLGPVVLNELNDSGHTYFPIYADKETNIVGVLNIDTISDNSSSKISSLMDAKLMYANEEQEVGEVLHAMLASGKNLFIVLNGSANYTGIITSKDILKALVGEVIIDDLDLYENKELVSTKFHTKDKDEVDNS
jgi:CBS domain containing-hemolysin-like protein